MKFVYSVPEVSLRELQMRWSFQSLVWRLYMESLSTQWG